MSSEHCSLNPLAPEYHPSTVHCRLQNHHYLHHDQPHLTPLRKLLHQNLFNFSTYYYLTTTTSLTIPAQYPSSLPTAPEAQTHLEPRTRPRGASNYQRRSGRRCLGRRAPATVSTVEGSGYFGRGRRRVVESRRRVYGNNNYSSKGEVMELQRDAACTTVMIRNIPARYTRELLMKYLDKHCKGMNTEASNSEFTSAYDFVYLPVDFRTNANKGFAFVNFTDPRAAWRFYETSNNQLWDLFSSSKIRQIVRAKLQGKENLMKHFRESTFRCESDDYLPVYFSPPRDGSAEEKVEITTVGFRVNPSSS